MFSVHPDALIRPRLYVMDNITHWACGQFVGSERKQVDQMLDLADEWLGAGLVTEDFVPQQFNQARAFLAPVRLNAAFSYCLGEERHLYYQMSSLGKTTFSEDRLKRLKRYWHGTEGMKDARSATQHGLTFLKRLKTQPNLCRQVFPALYMEA